MSVLDVITRVLIMLVPLFMMFIIFREMVVHNFLLKILHEDLEKYLKKEILNPYKRHNTMNRTMMMLQFWVWPLERYLPEEEENEN